MSDEIRPWRCENGHVLGQVERNGSGVRVLMLYREAVDLSEEQPDQVDVMAVIMGYAPTVRCSVCGAVRTWVPGEETMRNILRIRETEVVDECRG